MPPSLECPGMIALSRVRGTRSHKNVRTRIYPGQVGQPGQAEYIPKQIQHPANQTVFCREYLSHHLIMHPGTAGTKHPSNGTATLSGARKGGPICPRARSKAARRPRLPNRTGGRYISPCRDHAGEGLIRRYDRNNTSDPP